MDADELRQALIAASNQWRQLNDARDEAKRAVFQAAADYLLGSDVQASEAADLTPFSDALIRKETRRLGVPERRRGPQRKAESKQTGNPATKSQASDSPIDYGHNLRTVVNKTSLQHRVELMDRLRHEHAGWYQAMQGVISAGSQEDATVEILVYALAEEKLAKADFTP